MARHFRNSRNSSKPDEPGARPHNGRGRRPAAEDERKDRVIQTRVPKDLENTLKDAAERKRMTVSHLIRNVLEDAFNLVDGIVADSSALVENVARDARKLAASARGDASRPDVPVDAPSEPQPLALPDTLSAVEGVEAWQDVIVNRPCDCARCGAALTRGQRAFRGVGGQPGTAAVWLCSGCIETL